MNIRKFSSIFGGVFAVLLLAFTASAQVEQFKANQEKTLVLKISEEKNYSLNLKKGDYAEIFWEVGKKSQDEQNPEAAFSIYAPSGKDISKALKSVINADSSPFIAPEDGEYKLVVKFDNLDEPKKTGDVKFTLEYKNRFVMPPKSKVKSQRIINGYNVKIIGTSSDAGVGYFIVEKGGKMQYILKGDDSSITGFYFADDASRTYSVQEKKSVTLMKTTPDKTGDGTPDVAVEYFSGGAHCCFDLLFFELGKEVKPIDVLDTGDARTIATRKNPTGGLRLITGDNTFAYWLTSFAGSPIPDVILDFKNGAFRPNLEAMKKPAPTAAVLQKKAAAAKKDIGLEPYTGVDGNNDFLNAFWGEMLDLMYSGHEDLAWKYLDMVWDSRKQGKELFIKDFNEQLAKSKFWQMMQQDKTSAVK